jgi:hypothetical protein
VQGQRSRPKGPWRACAGLALHDLVLAGATGEGLLIMAQSTALRHAPLPGLLAAGQDV